MKKAILIIALIIITMLKGYSQQARIRYGIEANQFSVQSGFSTCSELKVFIQDEKGKRISLGVYYDSKLKTMGGIGASYIKMVRNHKKSKNTLLEPYIIFNLLYRVTHISEPISSENYNIASGTYSSFEYYLGFGLRTNITQQFYLTTELGYGLYLGSIMKPSAPDHITFESTGTNGTGGIARVGIGYFF